MAGRKALPIALTSFFALILLSEYFYSLFPDWTFKAAVLIVGNRILSYTSFFALLFCIGLLFKAGAALKIIMGVAFGLLLGMLSCSELFPIDTTTEPIDVGTIRVYEGGKKSVARQYKNAKTNETIRDTVLVKDVLFSKAHFSLSSSFVVIELDIYRSHICRVYCGTNQNSFRVLRSNLNMPLRIPKEYRCK